MTQHVEETANTIKAKPVMRRPRSADTMMAATMPVPIAIHSKLSDIKARFLL